MNIFSDYTEQLTSALKKLDLNAVSVLSTHLFEIWRSRRRLFICGNGGSAGNAIHIANDFTYGINPHGIALDVEALPAILQALHQAKLMGVTTFAILGFDGGKALHLADHVLHVKLNDMQIAEDIQVIIGHMLMKSLFGTISEFQKNPLEFKTA